MSNSQQSKGRRGKLATDKAKKSPILDITKNIDICPECENTVDDNENGLNCEDCNKWWHARCLNISSEKYKWLSDSENIVYVCKECKKMKSEGPISNAALMTKLNSMMQTLSDVLASNVSANQAHSDLAARVTALEESRTDTQTNTLVNIQKQVKEEVSEMNERERRRFNVIIQNIPEGSGEEAEEDEDKAKVVEILNKVTEINPDDISTPIRLGPKGTRARALKITLKNDKMKHKIIKNYFNKINKKGTSPKECIYINNDMTPAQRKEDQELREELKQRRLTEKDLIIRNGKIITRPTGGQSAPHPGSPTGGPGQ